MLAQALGENLAKSNSPKGRKNMAHTATNVLIHFIFSTHHREPLIAPEIQKANPGLAPWALLCRRFAAPPPSLESLRLEHDVQILGVNRPRHRLFTGEFLLKH